MKPLLVIMNPRRIDECVESYEALAIDKAWLTAYTEGELVGVIPSMFDATREYTHYVWVSDDIVANQAALDAVLDGLEAGHPVVTGYCNFDLTDDPRVGLSKSPLVGEAPGPGAYDFPTQAWVDAYPDEVVPTFFAGFVLTGMSRELWLRYPFRLGPLGAQTDYSLCWRLQQDGVPIVAPKAARVLHVKEKHGQHDRDPRKRLLIGEVPAEVRLELGVAA